MLRRISSSPVSLGRQRGQEWEMLFLLLTWGGEEWKLRGVGLGSPCGGAGMSPPEQSPLLLPWHLCAV